MKFPLVACALVTLLALGVAPTARAEPYRTAENCRTVTSDTLAQMGDALTFGSERAVLAAAVAGDRRAGACGAIHDSISLKLVSADLYDDAGAPRKRCAALLAAARLAKEGGEQLRAASIRGAYARSCR